MKGDCHIGTSLAGPCLSLSAYTAVFQQIEYSLQSGSPRLGRHSWPWIDSWTEAAAARCFLRCPKIAELVVAALRDGDDKFLRYELHAFVVMPNHVHLLVTP